MARVGVLLPVYNAEKFLKGTLTSIFSQTYSDFNLYIIDDGSTDKSQEIIKSFSDKRIINHKLPSNQGVTKALNVGLDLISEEYIIRMDADDLCKPNRFEKLVGYMDMNPQVIVCGSQVNYFGNETGCSKLAQDDNTLKAELLFGSCFIHPTVILRNSILRKEKLQYPYGYLHHEDFAFWRILMKKGEFHNLSDNLVNYRIEGQNISLGNNSLKADRCQKIFSEILSEIGIEVTEKNLRLHTEMAGLKSVDNIRELLTYKRKLLKLVSSNKYYNQESLDKIIRNRLDLLFCRETDKSRTYALNYWIFGGHLKFEHIRYFTSTIFKKRIR